MTTPTPCYRPKGLRRATGPRVSSVIPLAESPRVPSDCPWVASTSALGSVPGPRGILRFTTAAGLA